MSHRFLTPLSWAVVLVWTATCSAVAAQDVSAIIRHDQTVSSFELENGLEVVVLEDHRAPVAVHMLWYRAGGADEKPGVSGIAHFLEHLLFKATDTLESGEFSRIVAAQGGSDNAVTSYDYTAYYQRVSADRLGLMMQMEADRMTGLRLTQNDIETERDVILEERSLRVDNDPGSLFNEQLDAALYLNHPYGTPLVGWRHEMEALSLDDAMRFYRRFYAPNNAILIVAGDVEPEAVRALAIEHYGSLKPNLDLKPRVRPSEPPHTAPRRLVYEDDRVAQPYLRRSYLAPQRDQADQKTAAALSLAARLLGRSPNGLLTKRLQFEQKLAVYATAFYRGASLDETQFSTIVVPAPGVSLEDAERALDETLEAFLEQPIDQSFLKRIKMQVRAQQIFDRDDVQGLANLYGRALTAGLTLENIRDWPDVIQSITEDDIKTALRAVLDSKAYVTGYITGPEPSEKEADQ